MNNSNKVERRYEMDNDLSDMSKGISADGHSIPEDHEWFQLEIDGVSYLDETFDPYDTW